MGMLQHIAFLYEQRGDNQVLAMQLEGIKIEKIGDQEAFNKDFASKLAEAAGVPASRLEVVAAPGAYSAAPRMRLIAPGLCLIAPGLQLLPLASPWLSFSSL